LIEESEMKNGARWVGGAPKYINDEGNYDDRKVVMVDEGA
jgi:hypothetical protein